jgi:hypothetical protein
MRDGAPESAGVLVGVELLVPEEIDILVVVGDAFFGQSDEHLLGTD